MSDPATRANAPDHVVVVLFENRSLDNVLGRPWNLSPEGAKPTMDGFVADYISTFIGEVGRQPTYEEYAEIMTGYSAEQLPVLNGIAREFGVFDHWFCEVPSQTFMNRSFWTAATSSGMVVNNPAAKWLTKNTAETIFERLEAPGKTWKVYVGEPMCIGIAGIIHYPQLKDRLATQRLPPGVRTILHRRQRRHRPRFAVGNARRGGLPGADLRRLSLDDLGDGSQRLDTSLLIGWDEPGGTYDHVPPGAVPHRGSSRVRSTTRSIATPR